MDTPTMCDAKSGCCEPDVCPLSRVVAGSAVRIKRLTSPPDVAHRLREIGFCEEQSIKLLSRHHNLICLVCNARLGISSQIADDILVEMLPQATAHWMMAEESQPLTSLTVGSKAVVTAITVPPEHRARLLEMGLLVGTDVELIRFAPLGDPIEIKVRGYHLSLRKHEAEQIQVRQA